VSLLGLLTLLLGVACGGAVWMWQRAEGARQRAETAEAEARQERDRLATELAGEQQAKGALEVALMGERKARGDLEAAQRLLAKAHDDLERLANAERIHLAQNPKGQTSGPRIREKQNRPRAMSRWQQGRPFFAAVAFS
jgi:hypothetical protein